MMVFFNMIIAIIALAVLIYAIKWTVVRLLLACKIKRFCRQKQLSLIITRRFWMLGTNGRRNCDFYIKFEDKIQAVKILSSSFFRLTKIIFTEEGEYFLEYRLPIVSYFASTVHNPIRTRAKKYTQYVFDGARSEEPLEYEKILLPCAAFCEAVKLHRNGKKELLYGGELLTQGLIYQTVSKLFD